MEEMRRKMDPQNNLNIAVMTREVILMKKKKNRKNFGRNESIMIKN